MKIKNNIQIVLWVFGLILLASCNRVVVIVDVIPSNTPLGEPIYISGNFNKWSLGEEKYRLTLTSDSTYYFVLPQGFGQVEYKFTRGNWSSVERGICGEEIENRAFYITEDDTIFQSIESWKDLDPINCNRCTILVELIPSNTPKDDIIAVASDLNSWNPDNASIAKLNNEGEYSVTIQRPLGVSKIEYKMTRGDLSSAEADEFGNEIPNRILEFGKSDTIKISVKSWADLPLSKPEQVVIILKSLPKLTPSSEPIYLASNLNSWYSGDKNYQFQRNAAGELYFVLPRKKMKLDYKITRLGWQTVEVDKNGFDIDNRQLDLEIPDTVYIDVLQWKDQEQMGDEDITVILKSLPANTPENDRIYIAGEFNDWNPGRLRHVFKKAASGVYYINLSRKRGVLEFKITRGSWESEALDQYGSELLPFKFKYSDYDTIFIPPVIANWKDKPTEDKPEKIILVLDKLPENTPSNSCIYLAPDFNGWNPNDEKLVFDRLSDGKYYISIPTHGNALTYKISRGGWDKVETSISGEEIANRVLYYGFADTVHLQVEGWQDFRN